MYWTESTITTTSGSINTIVDFTAKMYEMIIGKNYKLNLKELVLAYDNDPENENIISKETEHLAKAIDSASDNYSGKAISELEEIFYWYYKNKVSEDLTMQLEEIKKEKDKLKGLNFLYD